MSKDFECPARSVTYISISWHLAVSIYSIKYPDEPIRWPFIEIQDEEKGLCQQYN